MQTEIPEDVMKAAVVAFNEAIDIDGYEGSCEVIARAIMAERERKAIIKPLDFRPDSDGDYDARSVFGSYNVWLIDNDWYVYFNDSPSSVASFKTSEKAKEFCQSDYEKRIRSALAEA